MIEPSWGGVISCRKRQSRLPVMMLAAIVSLTLTLHNERTMISSAGIVVVQCRSKFCGKSEYRSAVPVLPVPENPSRA